MRLSDRVQRIVPGGSDGWELYYRARSMSAAGTPVVMLSIGDHDVGPDAGIANALTESLRSGHTGYTPVEGTDALRKAVATRQDPPASIEEVVITCGGQAALFAGMMAVLDPGESCVVLDPYYATYSQTVRAAGGDPIVVKCRPEDGFEPDASAIEAALRPDTRAILLNTPNNPTGAVYSESRLLALAELAKRRGLWILSDEVYATQVWSGRHISPRDLPGMAEHTLVLGSMSKSHGMTGFRVGWVLGPAEAVRRISELAVTTTYGLPGFIQDAATHGLVAGATAEDDLRARYAKRREVALAALGQGPGYHVVAPAGGMYLLLDIRATGLSGTAFAERLLDEAGINVMPGESFGSAAAGHIRVALTVPEDVLVPALKRIAGMAEALAADVPA